MKGAVLSTNSARVCAASTLRAKSTLKKPTPWAPSVEMVKSPVKSAGAPPSKAYSVRWAPVPAPSPKVVRSSTAVKPMSVEEVM